MSQFDVVIIGGGMVGLAQAGTLASSGFSVALIEPEALAPGSPYPLRVSAINHASERLMMQLGCADQALERAGIYGAMEVWDAGSRGQIHFDAREAVS